jgi:hypothetical protein
MARRVVVEADGTCAVSEQSPRVIVGAGRVVSVGAATEYAYTVTEPPLRSAPWERNIGHSTRPGFVDGFLFPYQEVLALRERGEDAAPEDFVVSAGRLDRSTSDSSSA